MLENELNEIINNTLNETSSDTRARKALFGTRSTIYTIGIMSPQNPRGKQIDEKENKRLWNEFIKNLSHAKFGNYKTERKYGEEEKTTIVYNISLSQVRKYATQYKQESFIFAKRERDGFAFGYYEDTKGDGNYVLKSEERQITNVGDIDDFYTAIGKKYKFNIPFAIFAETAEQYNETLTQRVPDINVREASIKESLDESFSERHRFYIRTALHGDAFK